MEIKKATRQGVKPLIGLFGKSGSGKTMSALLLARGMAGNGRVVLIDTENGRGSIFADLIPGGYDVLDLDAPFSPERYIAAIEAAEKQAAVIVIDSMSHEWAGEGGVLDWQEQELTRMAGDDWKKREACKMASWIKPKMAHKKMVMRLLRTPLPLICCLRAEEKTHIEKENGKTKVLTDDFSTPLFDSRFIFEMLTNMETVAHEGNGGFARVTKVTHPEIWKCLPKDNEQIGIKHGQLIAAWANGTAQIAPPKKKTAKAELWEATKDKHGGDPAKLEAWLREEDLITTDETLAGLTDERMVEITKGAGILLF